MNIHIPKYYSDVNPKSNPNYYEYENMEITLGFLKLTQGLE